MAGLHRAGALLLAHDKQPVWAHSQAVAEAAVSLAMQFSLDVRACEEAGLCHDLGCLFRPEEMLDRMAMEGRPLDPAEERFPFLLHQRFSEVLCRERLGIEDARVLSAVACHTTLKPQASPVDMAVYLADKIAWDRPGDPPYAPVVSSALEVSLAAACLAHMEFVLQNGMILMPHQQLLASRDWLKKTPAV